jgi:hypothetical protein
MTDYCAGACRAEGRPVKPSRWEAVRRLFEGALSESAGGRASFLAARCESDPSLIHEVQSLLAAYHAAKDGRFVRDPVQAVAAEFRGMRESDRKRR